MAPEQCECEKVKLSKLESLAVGLKMHMNKSKLMLNKRAGSTLFSLGNEMLEQVEEYNYLGQVVSDHCVITVIIMRVNMVLQIRFKLGSLPLGPLVKLFVGNKSVFIFSSTSCILLCIF